MFIERALKTFIVISVIFNKKCLSVNVPLYWGYDASSAYSENKPTQLNQQKFAVETFDPKNFKSAQTPIPVQYFEYKAPKPNFAVEIATLHGVKNPHQHYKSYPIYPYTRQPAPELGKHTLLNPERESFQPYQKFVKGQGFDSPVTPIKSDFEVYHPYKSEKKALKQIYKDPVLDKIRGDLRSSQLRLYNYEKAAGEPNITKSEYLESLDETDRKHGPQTNIPAAYEIHRPQRKPVYYNPTPSHDIRDHYLNKKFKHPLRQDYIKITPVHYFPLKNQLQQLRQSHASKYDDEHNEYPQIIPSQQFAEPPEGYDIYEKGKQKYIQLRNNVDNTVNKVLNDNRVAPYGRLELQNNDKYNEQEQSENEAHEFVPIKNYAQVRKTETMKHLPKSAAYEEAENFDELRNAPRLKEAIKSTKAQTVYTEEGYEDSAYDHAGEQKHAADHERHAGYLKEHKKSDGKYKAPSFSGAFDDANGSVEGDLVTHGNKWEKVNKDTEEEVDTEDFAEDDHEKVTDEFTDDEQDTTVSGRDKRENNSSQQGDLELGNSNSKSKSEEDTDDDLINHDVNKREVNFEIPEFSLNNTFLTEDEILKISKDKIPHTETSKKDDTLFKKYPYYTKEIGEILRDSPLRYAENFKLIPRKSGGGTEFYDSRSNMACPDVDEEVDPIPEKIKLNGTQSNSGEDEEGIERTKRETSDKTVENQKPRLSGLGDKIDCFKAKYFGENPLDSPFFKEDLIGNPEPVTLPNHPVYKLKRFSEPESKDTKFGVISNITARLKDQNEKEITSLFDKLKLGQEKLQQTLIDSNTNLKSSLINSQQSAITPIIVQQNTSNDYSNVPKSNLYTSIFDNINKDSQRPFLRDSIFGNNFGFPFDTNSNTKSNKTSNIFLKPTEITYHAPYARQKRSGPFVYEPYKIIKEDQSQESKKTTTLSNVGPLIKKLQSSKVADKIGLKVNPGPESSNRQNFVIKTYKEIGKNDRMRNMDFEEPEFIDVSTDPRRGEPRYEIKHFNHKSEYEPIVNKKSLTLEEYKSKINQDNDFKTTTQSTKKPFYDLSQFLPKPIDLQNTAASRTVHRIIRSTTPAAEKNSKRTGLVVKSTPQKQEQDEEYEEYYEDEEPVTTTTTIKPVFRRRRTTTSTTEQPTKKNDKLRLVTRFRESIPAEEVTKKPEMQVIEVNEQKESNLPKYREKSTKSSKSTLVTDTKRYGGDDDDMKKEEIDKLIGVKQNMEDYKPEYEKKMNDKGRTSSEEAKGSHNEEDYDDGSFSDEIDDDDDDEFSDEDDYDEEENQEEEEEEKKTVPTTTPKNKNIFAKTTEKLPTTTEARSEKLQHKPVVMKKKIEIHKELPVNTSAPHVTQFKQNIKEVEIIKEVPHKKPSKNTEVLDLYKDENLPREINKLGDVEVFKANLDLNGGPKHGGNYRSAKLIELADNTSPRTLHGGNLRAQAVVQKEDAVSSQSQKSRTNVPVNRMHGGNLRSLSEIASTQQPNAKRRRGNKNAKTVELNEKLTEPMHGGNLRSYSDINRKRVNTKVTGTNDNESVKNDRAGNAELHSSNLQTYTRNNNNNNGRSLHEGNYRSAKVAIGERTTESSQPKRNNDERTTAAKLLSSFVQAAPILTTTPSYILDPSKRMYFYVEA